MSDDIRGGIKNALERGATLDQIIKSFISAGYNEAEVKTVAKEFSGQEFSSLSYTNTESVPRSIPKIPQKPSQKSPEQYSQIGKASAPTSEKPFATQLEKPQYDFKTKRKIKLKIVILVLVLLMLLGVLGATIFYRTEMIDFLTGLF